MFTSGVAYNYFFVSGSGADSQGRLPSHNSMTLRRKSDYDKLAMQIRSPSQELIRPSHSRSSRRYQQELPPVKKRPITKFDKEMLRTRLNQIIEESVRKQQQKKKVAEDYFKLKDFPGLRRYTLSQLGRIPNRG